MFVVALLAASVLLQVAAAVFALRLVWCPGVGKAWGLIAAAILLMAVRRAVPLVAVLAGYQESPPAVTAELIGLAVSVLMVIGIVWMTPFFVSVRRSDEALRESQRRLTTLMNNLPGMAYRCRNDRVWTMEFISEGCLPLTGCAPADLVENRRVAYGELIHPDDRGPVWHQVQEALGQRRAFRLVYRIRAASGEEKWVWEQGAAVHAADGSVVALEGFITDITDLRRAEQRLQKAHEGLERRVGERTAELQRANEQLKREIQVREQMEEALRESEQRFRGLVESTSDWIWEIDAAGMYTYASPKVEDLLGYKPDEVVGRTPFDLMPPDEARRAAEIFGPIAARREPFTRQENANWHKDGRLVILETSGVPILDAQGNLRGYRGVDRDITKPKEDEAKLLRAMVELEQSNRDLQQFAYSASHDLQEPLRMMASYLEALQRQAAERLDENSRSFIRLSLDSARRMQKLINDLLAYARVGTRGKQFQPVAAGKVVDRVVTDLQQAIQDTGAVVTRDELPTVTADPTLLAQLFQNLIGNAVKFHGDQPPRVHVRARDAHSHWEFSVKDNGIGIDPAHANRIFAVFERLHGEEQYPGTGIGLAICKRVVERHGGTIWFESEREQGTTFFFTIPK